MAVEVKADAAPGPEAARHLRWLREELGQRFLGGVILHTGRRTYEVANGIPAVPICALWG